MMKTKTLHLALIMLIFFLIPAQSTEKGSNLINLGENINSICNELNPVISSDGNTLYFCRDECPDGELKQNIWAANKQPGGEWGKARKLGPPLNNEYNNFVSSVSPDGNSLLLGSIYKKNGKMGRGVSISHRTNNGWSFPQPLEIEDYYNMNEFGGFFMASNRKTLLLAIQRKDSYGLKDLYVSFKKKNGKWSSPKNLGKHINTPGDEISPFLAPDGVTLYFSTDGREGYGSSDIYYTRRQDNSWNNWSEPENMGPEVNTTGWDAYYKTDASGEYAYCVSVKETFGKSDIFRIKIPDQVKPEAVMLVKGEVKSYKSLAPLEAQITYETLPEGKEFGTARSNPGDGAYKMPLPAGNYYSYRARAKEYLGSNQDLDLKKLKEYNEIERDLYLVPAEDSLICIRNVFFDSGETGLSKESKTERQRLVKFMRENPKTVVEVTGYTDNTGSVAVNRKISKKRAATAVEYLTAQGISEDRIIMKGFAKDKYIRPNDSPENRALNRRVEFKVYERQR